MSDVIRVTSDAGVATVWLNRPSRGNSLDEELLVGITEAFTTLGGESGVRAIVLAAEGRFFCTGGDLEFIAPFAKLGPAVVAETVYRRFGLAVRTVLLTEKPVVCAVNGLALGAGCDLALACDVRIASEDAEFGEAWVDLGTLPALGGLFLLPRIVGHGRATEIILSGRRVAAQEALSIGLVSRVVSRSELVEHAQGLAADLAAKPARAVRLIKKGLARAADGSLASELEWAAVAQSTLICSPSFEEGVSAIAEHRKPQFAAIGD